MVSVEVFLYVEWLWVMLYVWVQLDPVSSDTHLP